MCRMKTTIAFQQNGRQGTVMTEGCRESETAEAVRQIIREQPDSFVTGDEESEGGVENV